MANEENRRTAEEEAILYKKLYARIQELAKDSAENSRSVTDIVDSIMSESKNSDKYIVEELKTLIGTEEISNVEGFVTSMTEYINRNADKLNKDFAARSGDQVATNRMLQELTNKIKDESKKASTSRKEYVNNVTNDMHVTLEHSSGDFKNVMENYVTVNNEGKIEDKAGTAAELQAYAEEVTAAITAERQAAEKQLEEIKKAINVAEKNKDSAKMAELNEKKEVATKRKDAANAMGAHMQKKASAGQFGEKATRAVNKETNARTLSGEKEIEAAKKASLGAFAVIQQGSKSLGYGLQEAGSQVGNFTDALGAAGGNLSAHTGPLGQAFGAVSTAFSRGLGPLALFAGAMTLATIAIKGYHQKMNVAREMGAGTSEGMVDQIRGMELKTLMPPEELKKLSDSVEGSFGTSLSKNQQEMEQLAIKQRLSDRVMGKEYAENQMSAMNELKNSLASGSAEGKMDELQGATLALAKTMGVSNKYALEQIKAINQNTKEIGKNMAKGEKAELNKQFQQMEAGWKAMGMGDEEIAEMRQMMKDAFTEDGSKKALEKAMLTAEMDPATLEKWAGATGAGSSKDVLGALQSLSVTKGNMNQAAMLMVQEGKAANKEEAMKILAKSVEATTLASEETTRTLSEKGDTQRVMLMNSKGASGGGIGEAAKSENAAQKRTEAAATVADRQIGEKQTKNLNAVLLSMGASDPKSKAEAMDKLVKGASAGDQAAIMAKTAQYAGKDVKTLEAEKAANPEEFAKKYGKNQEDAYKTVMADKIKAAAEGGDGAALGVAAGVDGAKAKSLLGDKDKFNEMAGKLDSTTTEQAGDALARTAIIANQALEKQMMKAVDVVMPALTSALEWLSGIVGALIPILLGLTAIMTAAYVAKFGWGVAKGGFDMISGLFGAGKAAGAATTVGGTAANAAGAAASGGGVFSKIVGAGKGLLGMGGTAGTTATTVGGAATTAGSTVGSAAASGGGMFSKILGAGKGLLGMGGGAGTVGSAATTAATTAGTAATTAATTAGGAATAAGGGMMSSLGGMLSTAAKFAGPIAAAAAVATAAYGAFQGWGKASEYFGKETVGFSEKMSSALAGVAKVFSFGFMSDDQAAGVAQWINGVFGGLFKGMEEAWDSVVGFMSRRWEAFKNIFAPVIEAGKKVIDDITNIFVSPFKAIWSLFTGDMSGFVTSVTQVFTSITSLFTTIPQLWSEALNAIWVWIKDLGQLMVYKFTDMFDDLMLWWDDFSFYDTIIDPIVVKIGESWDALAAWWDEYSIIDNLITPMINKIIDSWAALSEWWSTFSFYDAAIKPLIDMVVKGIAGFMDGVKKKAVDLLGETVAKTMGIVDDKDLERMKSSGKEAVASGGKVGKELFNQMADSGMGEKNRFSKDTVKAESLGTLSTTQLDSLKELKNLSAESKKSIEAELAARKAGTKVQEKVTDATGKAVTTKAGSAAELTASGVLGESSEKGKKSIKDMSHFQKLSQKEIDTFLDENKGSLDKDSIKQLRGARNAAKSEGETEQLKRAEEIKKQPPPQASEKDKERAAAVVAGVEKAKEKAGQGVNYLKEKAGQGLEAAKTKVGEYVPELKKALEGVGMDPKIIDKMSAAFGGKSDELMGTLKTLALAGGDMNQAAMLMVQEGKAINTDEALKKLASATEAATLATKESNKLAKAANKEDQEMIDLMKEAGMTDAEISELMPDLAKAPPTGGIIDAIMNGFKAVYEKGAAVVSNTVAAGKQVIDTGKKAYDESRSSGKGVMESIGAGANAGLGSLSAKYESGKKGSEAVGWDSTGGTSYGKYQIAAKTGTMDNFLKFAEKNNPEVAARLKAAGPADGGKDGAFAQEWKKLAAEGKMGNLEHDFIQKSHYDPAMNALKGNKGVSDMINNSAALQDVMWSTSVQHGAGAVGKDGKGGSGAAGIFNKVYKEGMTEEELIKAVYAERGTKFGSSTEGVQKSVKARFADEEKNALAMVGKKPGSPTDVLPPTNPETGNKATTGDANNRISPQAAGYAVPKSEGGAGLHQQKPNAPPAGQPMPGAQTVDATKKASATPAAMGSPQSPTGTAKPAVDQATLEDRRLAEVKANRERNIAALKTGGAPPGVVAGMIAAQDAEIKKLEDAKAARPAAAPAGTAPTGLVEKEKDADTGAKKLAEMESARQRAILEASNARLSGDKAGYDAKRKEIADLNGNIKNQQSEIEAKKAAVDKPSAVTTAATGASGTPAAMGSPQSPTGTAKPVKVLSPEEQRQEDLKKQRTDLSDQITKQQRGGQAVDPELRKQYDAVNAEILAAQSAAGVKKMAEAAGVLSGSGRSMGTPHIAGAVGGMAQEALLKTGLPPQFANPLAGEAGRAVGGMAQTALASTGMPPGIIGAFSSLVPGIMQAFSGGRNAIPNTENLKQQKASGEKKTAEEMAAANAKKGIDDKQANDIIATGKSTVTALDKQNAMVAKQPTVADAEKLQNNANAVFDEFGSNFDLAATHTADFNPFFDENAGVDAAVKAQGVTPGVSTPVEGLFDKLSGIGASISSNIGGMFSGATSLGAGISNIGATMFGGSSASPTTPAIGSTVRGAGTPSVSPTTVDKSKYGNEINGQVWDKENKTWVKKEEALANSKPAPATGTAPPVATAIDSAVKGAGTPATAVPVPPPAKDVAEATAATQKPMAAAEAPKNIKVNRNQEISDKFWSEKKDCSFTFYGKPEELSHQLTRALENHAFYLELFNALVPDGTRVYMNTALMLRDKLVFLDGVIAQYEKKGVTPVPKPEKKEDTNAAAGEIVAGTKPKEEMVGPPAPDIAKDIKSATEVAAVTPAAAGSPQSPADDASKAAVTASAMPTKPPSPLGGEDDDSKEAKSRAKEWLKTYQETWVDGIEDPQEKLAELQKTRASTAKYVAVNQQRGSTSMWAMEMAEKLPLLDEEIKKLTGETKTGEKDAIPAPAPAPASPSESSPQAPKAEDIKAATDAAAATPAAKPELVDTEFGDLAGAQKKYGPDAFDPNYDENAGLDKAIADQKAMDAAAKAPAKAADGGPALTPEQLKWMGGADQTDPFILARMRSAVPNATATPTDAITASAAGAAKTLTPTGTTKTGPDVIAASAASPILASATPTTGLTPMNSPLRPPPATMMNPALAGVMGNLASRAVTTAIPGTSGIAPTLPASIPMNSATSGAISTMSTINNTTNNNGGSSGTTDKLLQQLVTGMTTNNNLVSGQTSAQTQAASKARQLAVDGENLARTGYVAGKAAEAMGTIGIA